jgi:hypothetical protein
VLARLSDEELAELVDAFDLKARYDQVNRTLALSVSVFSELADILQEEGRPEAAGRSKSLIAGARFEPATSRRGDHILGLQFLPKIGRFGLTMRETSSPQTSALTRLRHALAFALRRAKGMPCSIATTGDAVREGGAFRVGERPG